jgi:hypothetical protein
VTCESPAARRLDVDALAYRLKRVPVVLSIVSVLACAQAAADPTESQAPDSTPQEATTDAQSSAWELPKLPLYQLLSHREQSI